MERESITARAASATVIFPQDARYRLTGRVPINVDGNRANANFMVTQVEESHFKTKVRKSVIALAYFS